MQISQLNVMKHFYFKVKVKRLFGITRHVYVYVISNFTIDIKEIVDKKSKHTKIHDVSSRAHLALRLL